MTELIGNKLEAIVTKPPCASSARQQARMTFSLTLPVLARAYKSAAGRAVGYLGISQSMAWPLAVIGSQGDGVRFTRNLHARTP